MSKIAFYSLTLLVMFEAVPAWADPPPTGTPAMLFGDSTTLGRPFSKDPSVVRFNGRYLMYYSLPGAKDGGNSMGGWSIGIAESQDLTHWHRVDDLGPAQEIDKKGLCAPGAIVLDSKMHLFYQSYGNGAKDAICR